ncbi:MAG TPA: Wzz/FepE/Etk N-terminal domain-containing protein, partial [Solirubrobacteraceae bacterium]|nr:Wzz/FepE/Etk N-terminal domain-containing protein [Solirubrobacteraceae bacterium]
MPLQQLLALVWKRRVVVVVVFLACIAAAAAYAYSQPKRYESTVTIAFTPKQGQFIPSENLSALLSTYAAVAKSDQNRSAARALLGHGVTGTISTSTGSGAGILEVIDEDSTPQRAAESVSAIAHAFVTSISGNGLLVATIVNPAVASD